MYFVNHYVIDWTKVKTQEDVITILKNLALKLPSHWTNVLLSFDPVGFVFRKFCSQ